MCLGIPGRVTQIQDPEADLVMGVIASPKTAVHLVTLLEEMPVQEAHLPQGSGVGPSDF